MKAPTAAASVAGTAVVLAATGWALQAAGRGGPETEISAMAALWSVVMLLFALVGALLVWRNPEHPVGWLLAAIGLIAHAENAAYMYARLGATPHDVPGGPIAEWLSYSMWPVTALLTALLLLVFPTGRSASARWRRYAWIVGVAGMTLAVVNAAEAWAARGALDAADPNPFPGLLGVVVQVLAIFVIGSLAVGAVGLVLRFRAATGLERQQLKLLALAMALLIGGIISGIVLDLTGWGTDIVTAMLYVVGVGGIPVAVGVAVLRYRLYEIDKIVSRTVTYAVVAGLLAAVFAGVAIGLPQLLSLPGESPLLVAASTLTVAALFNPLRRRVQAVVDLRFNRSRYDAQRTVEAFTSRLRDEVDLEQLSAELLVVVTATMQPAQAGVWLRPSGGDSQ